MLSVRWGLGQRAKLLAEHAVGLHARLLDLGQARLILVEQFLHGLEQALDLGLALIEGAGGFGGESGEFLAGQLQEGFVVLGQGFGRDHGERFTELTLGIVQHPPLFKEVLLGGRELRANGGGVLLGRGKLEAHRIRLGGPLLELLGQPSAALLGDGSRHLQFGGAATTAPLGQQIANRGAEQECEDANDPDHAIPADTPTERAPSAINVTRNRAEGQTGLVMGQLSVVRWSVVPGGAAEPAAQDGGTGPEVGGRAGGMGAERTQELCLRTRGASDVGHKFLLFSVLRDRQWAGLARSGQESAPKPSPKSPPNLPQITPESP